MTLASHKRTGASIEIGHKGELGGVDIKSQNDYALRVDHPALDSKAFETGQSLPDGIAEPAVQDAIECNLRRITYTRPRRDPITPPDPHIFLTDLPFVAGGMRDRRPIAVWRYARSASRDPSLAPARTDLTDRHLVVSAVGARDEVYFAHYPPEVGPVRTADEASMLAAEDGILHAERERILTTYRQPCSDHSKRWRSYFELAIVSAGCEVDMPPLPGSRHESIEAAREAARRTTTQAKVHAVLGWLLEREAHFSEAADAYGRAAKLAKRNVLFAWAWADSLAFAGRTDEAKVAFDVAHQRDRASRGPTFNPGRHRHSIVDRLDTWIIDQSFAVRRKREDLQPADGSGVEQSAMLAVDPAQVPAQFRDLIPNVEIWAIGDDAAQTELVERATPAQKKAIANALEGRRRELNDWLDTFDENNLTSEAAAFMTFLLACEEMKI